MYFKDSLLFISVVSQFSIVRNLSCEILIHCFLLHKQDYSRLKDKKFKSSENLIGQLSLTSSANNKMLTGLSKIKGRSFI